MALRAGNGRHQTLRKVSCIESLEARLQLSAVSYAKPVTSSISTTGPASAVAVGDINGDGIPDLVASSAGGAAVLGGITAQVFLGTKTGTLTPSTVVGSGGEALALGDFTGDGKLDLATAAGILPGNGNGGFGAVVPGFTLPSNTDVVNFYTADFNGDGKLDLALATFTAASGPGPAKVGMDIMLGKGNGTFQAPVVTSVGSGTSVTQADAVFATGDFNGDGKLDVVSPFGVLLGNGKGAFTAPSQGLPVSSTPVGTAFAVGDFNGDGKLDLAMVPHGEAAGQVEIFQGNGDGTFRDVAPVVVNTGGGTVSALAAADVNGDGVLDLIAGTTSGGNNPTINILTGSGKDTFTAAQSVGASAVPLEFFTGDFNGDKVPDILSIDQAAGTTTGALAGLNAASVDVLLSSSSTTPASGPATVTVTASPTSALLGSKVILTATVAGPAGAAAPTGTVTFYSGKTVLGTGTIHVGGAATLVTSKLPLGIQRISAAYSGDANYPPVKSRSIQETVLATTAKTPLLVPAIAHVSFPGTFVSGDRGTVNVTITNGGASAANGRVLIALYASSDGKLDSSSTQIAIRRSNRPMVHIDSGRSTAFVAPITIGDLPSGNYTILAQVLPISGLTTAQVSSTAVASTGQYHAAGHVFGTIARRRNVPITVTAPDGQVAVLKLTGAGAGSYTVSGGTIDVTVTGTRPASTLRISSTGGAFPIGALTVTGPLARLDARQAAITQSILLSGKVGQLLLGNVNAASLVSTGSVSQLTVSSITGGRWSVAGNINSLNIVGSLTSGTIAAGGRIKSISIRGPVTTDSRILAMALPRTALLAGTRVATATDPHFRP